MPDNDTHRLTEVKEKQSLSVETLSQALYTINRHAKTAPDPTFLYSLKKRSLQKLIKEGKAKKCGLHFSPNPKNSKQRSDLLIIVGNYYFHMPPSKEDFKQLPHLGKLDQTYRNPKTNMSLSTAKAILIAYTGMADKEKINNARKKYQKPVFKKLGETY